MSNLPDLPSGFGRDSAYPPMPSRIPEAPHNAARNRISMAPRPAFMSAPSSDAEGGAANLPHSMSQDDLDQAEAIFTVGDASPVTGPAHKHDSPERCPLRRPKSHQPLSTQPAYRPTQDPAAIRQSFGATPMGRTHSDRPLFASEQAHAQARAQAHVEAEAKARAVQERAKAEAEARAEAEERAAHAAQASTSERDTAEARASELQHARMQMATKAAASQAQHSLVTKPANTSAAHSTPMLPAIRVSLPDVQSLEQQRLRVNESDNDLDKLRWAVQVLKYVERMRISGTELEDPVTTWIEEAITQIVQCASHPQPKAEALYARGDLLASGAFPAYVAKDLRSAFSDFERSARMGWAPSWFRIGRDYETLGDIARARTAYGRGVQRSDVGCMYRMGMAKVMGQLEVPQDLHEGISLLQASADASTVDTPHPAYVYGLILAGELSTIPIPIEAFATPDNPSPTRASLMPLGREYLQRAAYLNLPAAQSKCGWCYEHAQLSFPFDPLMSVQYYSAASQGGEPEADMALSKWFLCGAEGCFDKNESLAWTFAERAAKHHLPTAEFAMGYYLEVGIGVPIDLEAARIWYGKASAQGNSDAAERLAALQASQSEALSRAQHQAHLHERLYSAHQRARKVSGGSQHNGGAEPTGSGLSGSSGSSGTELARRRTMLMAEASAQRRRTTPVPAHSRTSGATSHGMLPTPTATSRPSKGPQTFSEMGYHPKHDKECTIC